ncbi:twin-arginine translocase subunit TatC [Halovenus rubra]|uniref:Sec-independent protein translocase protein TatC n=2 Tax=Halovenus rubra TaxID=869890 RepID=A0ABD5X228_9EURY|nr:twin-arginine translocase subunit TatC [Halovenus rubra]
MSGAIDEDTARSLANGRAAVGSMLSTAQTHLKKVFLIFVTVMMLTLWGLRAFIWDRLKQDLVYDRMDVGTEAATEIIVTTPFDVILLQVKIGVITGIVLSIPALVYYSRDSLRRRGYWPASKIPRWKLVAFGVAIVFLTLVGVSYAYFLFFPIMFDFLAENAIQAGFKPTWSIVLWTEFIFFLAFSFGLAAQLPLFMSATARAGIVPYETYREKWRYAVVGIFIFGAMFSPPDPFTQVMWGVPLVFLYFFSLGIAKLAVLSKRAGEQVSTVSVAKSRWNVLVGAGFLSVASVYAYLLEGGVESTNDLLDAVGSQYRVALFPDDLAVFGLEPVITAVGLGVLTAVPITGIVLFYSRVQALEQQVKTTTQGQTASPTAEGATETQAGEAAEIDLGAMSEPAIRAASVEAFVELGEETAIEYAEAAVENDNPKKARAILDRVDDANDVLEEQAKKEEQADDEESEDEDDNILTSTAAGMVDPFTDDETDEDDIGGYYYDIRFILDSLTSKAIWIVATFMTVLAGSFMWLYLGGIGQVRETFFRNMPEQLVQDPQIVVLHPVEALIFMIKFSTLLAGVSIVPILLYFAWPAIEKRGVTTGDRNVILVWGVSLFVGLAAGTAVGFFYIAPTTLSLLATDVVNNSMIIAYRISSFGWLVIYLTVGVGGLAMIPVTMVLFNYGDIVPYSKMRGNWRVAVIAMFAAAGFLSPNGLWTMFIVAIPASIAYGLGLSLCWLYTQIGSRVPTRRGEAAD